MAPITRSKSALLRKSPRKMKQINFKGAMTRSNSRRKGTTRKNRNRKMKIQIKKEKPAAFRSRIFKCPRCLRGFTLKASVTRHLKSVHGDAPRYPCVSVFCTKTLSRKDSWLVHIRNCSAGFGK